MQKSTEHPEKKNFTVWSIFKENTEYFQPSQKDFMFNFRVQNLEELIKVLKQERIQIVGEIESFTYGKFAHIMDPEGNKIELWEANDEEFEKILKTRTY
jgi:predicted enzyme related to lactoylglutathione lyase